MEVRLALLADTATIDEKGKLNVLGAFDGLAARQFPHTHLEMVCVIRFRATPAEFGRVKEVEIVVLDPDGERLRTVSETVYVPPQGSGRSALLGKILNLENLTFPNPGDYAFAILVGGEEKWSIPLMVVQI